MTRASGGESISQSALPDWVESHNSEYTYAGLIDTRFGCMALDHDTPPIRSTEHVIEKHFPELEHDTQEFITARDLFILLSILSISPYGFSEEELNLLVSTSLPRGQREIGRHVVQMYLSSTIVSRNTLYVGGTCRNGRIGRLLGENLAVEDAPALAGLNFEIPRIYLSAEALTHAFYVLDELREFSPEYYAYIRAMLTLTYEETISSRYQAILEQEQTAGRELSKPGAKERHRRQGRRAGHQKKLALAIADRLGELNAYVGEYRRRREDALQNRTPEPPPLEEAPLPPEPREESPGRSPKKPAASEGNSNAYWWTAAAEPD